MKERSELPEEGKKAVRVDHKTIIFVNEDIPDDIAIAEWKKKIQFYQSDGGRKKRLTRKNDGLQFMKDDD